MNFLIRLFVRDADHVEDEHVRTAYGTFSSILSLICNLCLFGGKLLAGLLLHSVAVLADAFNNLSDAASCTISIAGVRMAGKPADREHPFGHGRMEYISALIVAFLVLEVGLSFLKDSVKKIWAPEQLDFSLISLIILCASVLVKLWMAYYNRYIGKKINSEILKATAMDAVGDVITTSATIVSVLVFRFLNLNIDAWIGILVALVVIRGGIGIAKDTLVPLLGQSISVDTYLKVKNIVESYDGIIGSHDLVIHNYGPSRSMASIHVEVSNRSGIEQVHEIVDKIERDVAKQMGLTLVIHVDPMELEDKYTVALREKLIEAANWLDPNLQIHDFHLLRQKDGDKIKFEVIVPFEYDDELIGTRKDQLKRLILHEDPKSSCSIMMEKGYVEK